MEGVTREQRAAGVIQRAFQRGVFRGRIRSAPVTPPTTAPPAQAKPSFLPAWLLESQTALKTSQRSLSTFMTGLDALEQRLRAFDVVLNTKPQPAPPPPPPPTPPLILFSSRAPLDVGGLVISFLGAQGAQNLARVHRTCHRLVRHDDTWRHYARVRWQWPTSSRPRQGWRRFALERAESVAQAQAVFTQLCTGPRFERYKEVHAKRGRVHACLKRLASILSNRNDHMTREVLLESHGVRALSLLLKDESHMIQELSAACLANMLSGMEQVNKQVLRLGVDRLLRDFLTSPTASVQNMAAKHACRALANLHMGWAAIVCPFDSDSHNTDEWQREMSSSASGAPEAMISEIVAAHTGAGRSAGREDRENNRSCDNGISTKGAGSGAGAGAGAGHKVDCPVRTGSESAKSEEDSDAAAAAEYMPFHTGRVPDQLRKALLRSGSWHRMAGDARRAWVAILDSWTLWHVHYLTKLGSLKEQVAIQLCLRRDGVLLAHGADAEGPFVLAGTFRPPSHTSAQVSFSFSKRYLELGPQGRRQDELERLAGTVRLHASIDGHVGHIAYSRSLFEGAWGIWEVTATRTTHFKLQHGGVFRMFPDFVGYKPPDVDTRPRWL